MSTQHESDNVSIEEKINLLCRSLEASGKSLADQSMAFEKKVTLTDI